MTRAGVVAAVEVARRQGLPADRPRLLSSRGNVIVHLHPAPVVAKAATLTAWIRADPFSWLEREVWTAGQLSSRGAPVVPPTTLADPGPHRHEGLAVTLWTLVPGGSQPGDHAGPAEAGRNLARLHAAGADVADDLPLLAPVSWITEMLDILGRERAAPADLLAALRERHAQVMAEIRAAGGRGIPVLHGDAHAGNLLRSGPGWVWVDLEEACRGPREFDLAALARSQGRGWDRAPGERPEQSAPARVALAAYAAEIGLPVPHAADLALFGQARDLEATAWLLGMAHQYPARYARLVPDMVAAALGSGLPPNPERRAR